MELERKIKEQLDKRDDEWVSNEYRAREIAEAIIHIKRKSQTEWWLVWWILWAILF